MSKKRAFSALITQVMALPALLLILITLLVAQQAWADFNPPTCSETGTALSLRELRDTDNDGVGDTPITGSKIQGETIYYEARLAYPGLPTCSYEGGNSLHRSAWSHRLHRRDATGRDPVGAGRGPVRIVRRGREEARPTLRPRRQEWQRHSEPEREPDVLQDRDETTLQRSRGNHLHR